MTPMLRKLRRADKRPLPLVDRTDRDDATVRAAIPSPFGDEPLLNLELRLRTEQQGERALLKLHARIDGALTPSPSRPPQHQLAAPEPRKSRAGDSDGNGGARLPALRDVPGKAASLVARRTADAVGKLPAVQRMAGHVHGEWMITASTHDRVQSRDLIPQAMNTLGFGSAPAETMAEPVVELSESVGDDGTANQMGLLQIGKRHLPPALAELLGDLPFHLSAAWLTQIRRR